MGQTKKIAIVGFLGLVIVTLGLQRSSVQRLLATLSLFSEKNIVKNFSSMDQLFFNTKIKNQDEVELFEMALEPLPESFQIDGLQLASQTHLDQTATTSLLVLKNGKIAFEYYALGTQPQDLRISWSVAKSFLSALFGIAVDKGQIKSLDDLVTDYVPELKNSAYRGVSLRHTLNMATGVRFDEDYLSFWSDINKMGRTLALGSSMDQFAMSLTEKDRKPGVMRKYTSIDTHVLAMVLRRATGQSLVELMGEQIVSVIGFEKDPIYLTDGYQVAFALGGLNLTTRDYARFGQMFLDFGRWHDKQIVPKKWAMESTQATAPVSSFRNDSFGYGYQWWIPNYAGPGDHRHGEFMARGIYGQYIYIDRQTQTVIVKTSANRKFREPGVMDQNLAFFRTVAGVELP